MANEDSIPGLDEFLRNHNSNLVKTLLANNLEGGIIPKELAEIADSYNSAPTYENSLALVKFDPKFISFFEFARKGGFNERLFEKGALTIEKKGLITVKDEFYAAISFRQDMLIYAEKNWVIKATKQNEWLKSDPPLPTDNNAVFDVFLAILFYESRASYNLFGQERGERIWQYLKDSFSVDVEHSDYAIETLELYLSVWNLYIKAKLNAIHGILITLLYKLGFEEAYTGPFFGAAISVILDSTPSWWKDFSQNNELVSSDIPYDSESIKKLFYDTPKLNPGRFRENYGFENGKNTYSYLRKRM